MRAASPWRTLGIRPCRHFVQTWPDSECSHTVQLLVHFSDFRTITFFSSGLTCFGTVWPHWYWCAVKLWYNQLIIQSFNFASNSLERKDRSKDLNVTVERVWSQTLIYILSDSPSRVSMQWTDWWEIMLSSKTYFPPELVFPCPMTWCIKLCYPVPLISL